MTGKGRQRKGKKFQKEVAADIRRILGFSETDCWSNHGGKTEPDIQLSDQAKCFFPYHLECKDHRKLQMPAWLRQAEEEAAPRMTPTVVFKIHNKSKKWIVLPLEDFLCLGKELHEA